MPPEVIAKEEEAEEEEEPPPSGPSLCPASHPHAFNGGLNCCSTHWRSGDDRLLELDDPEGKCKTSKRVGCPGNPPCKSYKQSKLFKKREMMFLAYSMTSFLFLSHKRHFSF